MKSMTKQKDNRTATKKTRRSLGARLVAGMEQATAHARGEAKHVRVIVPDDFDIKAIRENVGLSQQAFADRYGFAVSALRDWEQKRRQPERTARVLLKIIAKEPKAVQRALAD